MRIGSLQNVGIEQWTPTYQRTAVEKLVPGFIVAQTYDVVARTNTLTITGYLVGTSQSNLASQIMTLKGYAIQKKVVWIDATDQYQGLSELVRITNLQGPTIDSAEGILTADFTLQCSVLLPWGTTLTNPFRATGIVLRDLNGQGAEYMLNPLEFDCNYQLNEIGQSAPYSFSWEFILDNQNPFTNATSIQETPCITLGTGTASASNPVAVNGASLPSIGVNSFDSLAIDSTHHTAGYSGAIDGGKSSPANGTYYGYGYNYGASGIDISKYDRIRTWFLCNKSGQQTYAFGIIDTSGNWSQWNFSLGGAGVWQNMEFNLEVYSNHSSTPASLTAVQYMYTFVLTAASYGGGEMDVWLQDIRVEAGYVNHCEDVSGWTTSAGTGITLSNDNTIYKQYNPNVALPDLVPASFKCSGTSRSDGHLDNYFTFPVGAWDLTNPAYDFLLIWARSDFGGNPTGQISFLLAASIAFSTYFEWDYTGLNSNQWYRFVVPLRNPTSAGGTPNLNSIAALDVISIGAHSQATTVRISEIAFDVGNPTYVECMLPDNIAQNINPTNNAIQVSSWNGSTYQNLQAEDAFGASSTYSYYPYYLSSASAQYIFNTGGGGLDCSSIYAPNTIGNAGNKSEGNYGSSTLTYTTAWGTNNRFGFMIKMPPATSDSVTGNLPSDDLSGFEALNKMRLRIVVYFSNDDCSYTGN